jgi:tripartite-type tricarboxylate transporter receptor subunit TctC
MRELGLGELPSAQAWWGLLTQAGVPEPVVRRLNAEFLRTFRDPKFLEYLDAQVTEPAVGTPEEFAGLIRSSRDQLGQLINKYNIPKQ